MHPFRNRLLTLLAAFSLALPLAAKQPVLPDHWVGTWAAAPSIAHIANSARQDGISLLSANALTFGGRPFVTIPAGALVVSDPVSLSLQPLSDVTISMLLPAQTISKVSGHAFAGQTGYIAPGDQVGKASLSNAATIHSWPFLKGLEIKLSGQHSAVVCFGDSITDGVRSTENANLRWPDVLAKRLQNSGRTALIAMCSLSPGRST